MSDKINVYWSNCNELAKEIGKSLWYSEPTNVYKRHSARRNQDIPDGGTTMFMCPAVQDKIQNTWSFNNVVNTRVKIKEGNIVYSHGLPIHPTPRQNSILDVGHLWFDLGWLFFSEEPLRASFTSPFLDCPSYLSQLSVPPARFDIGQWFRPFNAEFLVWDTSDSDIVISEGDPLFYVEFDTDRKVELIRFEQTDKILEYATGCSKSTQFFGRGTSLEKRYSHFENSSLKKMILREILGNLV